MEKTFMTHRETVAILRQALRNKGKGHTIKAIAESIDLKPNTLYKWLAGKIELSPHNTDMLLFYFIENEPERLLSAAHRQTDVDFRVFVHAQAVVAVH